MCEASFQCHKGGFLSIWPHNLSFLYSKFLIKIGCNMCNPFADRYSQLREDSALYMQNQ